MPAFKGTNKAGIEASDPLLRDRPRPDDAAWITGQTVVAMTSPEGQAAADIANFATGGATLLIFEEVDL